MWSALRVEMHPIRTNNYIIIVVIIIIIIIIIMYICMSVVWISKRTVLGIDEEAGF